MNNVANLLLPDISSKSSVLDGSRLIQGEEILRRYVRHDMDRHIIWYTNVFSAEIERSISLQMRSFR